MWEFWEKIIKAQYDTFLIKMKCVDMELGSVLNITWQVQCPLKLYTLERRYMNKYNISLLCSGQPFLLFADTRTGIKLNCDKSENELPKWNLWAFSDYSLLCNLWPLVRFIIDPLCGAYKSSGWRRDRQARRSHFLKLPCHLQNYSLHRIIDILLPRL